MKQRATYSILILSFLILCSAVCSTSVLSAEQVTISGTVLAMDWDNEGRPNAGFIYTSGGEYQIVDNAVGRQLFKLGNRAVKVTGVVGEDSEGDKTIAVIRYEFEPE